MTPLPPRARAALPLFAALICWGAFCASASAHDGLHERLEAVTKAIAREPNAAPLWVQRAELNRLHRDWFGANEDLDRATRLAPSLPAIALSRARLAIDRGNDAQAARWLDRYIDAQPEAPIGFALRADLHGRAGRAEEAARDFENAIRRSPEPPIEQFLAWSRYLAASGRTDAAMAALDTGIQRYGPLVSLEHPAVELLVGAQRWDDALARLRTMMQGMGPNEALLTRQAEVLLAAGRPEQSALSFLDARTAWSRLPQHARETPAMQRVLARIESGLSAAQRGASAQARN